MKKVLSIVLAVMMLSSIAFAATPALTGTVTPHASYSIAATDFDDTDGDPITTLIGAKYTVKTVTWTKGRSLVDTVKVDDAATGEDAVIVTLKANYTLEKETDLEGIITLSSKTAASPADIVKATVTGVKVVNTVTTIEFTERNEEKFLDDADKGEIYKIDASQFGGGTLFLQDPQGEYEFVVKVYDKDKFYLVSNRSVNKDIILANEDVEADYINFINFPAKPTFKSGGTLKFLIDKEDYVYEVKDGKLVDAKATWNEDEGVYEIKGVKTLGSYVFSDAKLKSAASTPAEEDPNPDTGANDVIGIATALAAVALVSAAAVSLKK